jgi:hypothetical protein
MLAHPWIYPIPARSNVRAVRSRGDDRPTDGNPRITSTVARPPGIARLPMLEIRSSLGPMLALLLLSGPVACGDADDADEASGEGTAPRVRLNLHVDPDQPRLDNFGNPAPEPPSGHAAMNPEFLLIGAHSAELVPNEFTMLGAGTLVFDSPHEGGAVDFAQLPVVEPGGELQSVPLSELAPGTYEYLRVSVSYQRYRVTGHAEFAGNEVSTAVEVASFVEGETYIESYELGDETVEVGGVKAQGYYGAWSQYTGVQEGQVPVGATTVPNPLDETSPIPVDSCVVTATFDPPLTITGEESEDLVLDITLSTNKSFEWEDDGDGKWQPYEEDVVDMGLRGMTVTVEP